MIEEINNASASISNSSKPDDPVCTFDLILFESNETSYPKLSASSMDTCRSFKLSTRAQRRSRRGWSRHKKRAKGLELGILVGTMQ